MMEISTDEYMKLKCDKLLVDWIEQHPHAGAFLLNEHTMEAAPVTFYGVTVSAGESFRQAVATIIAMEALAACSTIQ